MTNVITTPKPAAKGTKHVVKPGRTDMADTAMEQGIRPEDLVDDRWYFRQLATVAQELRDGKMSVLNAGRRQKYLTDLYKLITGEDLSRASRKLRSAVDRLEDESILERNEAELEELREVIEKAVGVKASKKKRWYEVIALTLRLQKLAQSCSVGTWLYVCRDSEGEGGVMQPAEIHLQFHENWKNRFTLTEAPPGHGKTVNLHGKKLYDIGNRPWRKCLYLNDVIAKATKELELIKKYIRSPRFQALYPDVRVLGRTEGARDSSLAFTVVRPNEFSREPTVEAAGSRSNTQGNGYNSIYVDDIVRPDETNHPAMRNDTNFKFETEHSKRIRDPETAEIHIVFTSWHEDDVPNRIKRRIRDGTELRKWNYVGCPLTFDADGEPISLWPGRYSPDFYKNEQIILSPEDFDRLYLLQCRPKSAQIIHRIAYYPADMEDPHWSDLSDEIREAYLERLETILKGEMWLSIDPSATSGKGSASCPALLLSITAQGYGYLVDAWHFPGDPVMFQQWVSDAICGQLSEGRTWRLPKRVDRVMWEEGSPQTAQVTLWEDFVQRDLRRRGFKWRGCFVRVRPRGLHSRRAVGKEIRLRNCAPYIHHGFVKLPGRMRRDGAVYKFICSPREEIRKVADALLNFPNGLTDPVDALTQWIIHNERRLKREPGTVTKQAQAKEEIYSTYKAGKAEMLKRLRMKDISDMEKEFQWTQQLLSG